MVEIVPGIKGQEGHGNSPHLVGYPLYLGSVGMVEIVPGIKGIALFCRYASLSMKNRLLEKNLG